MKIIFIGGDKGGVGKSLASSAFANYMIEKEIKCVLIETDTSNPDVARQFEKESFGIDVHAMRLIEKNDWLNLADLLEKYVDSDSCILINSKAAISEEIIKNSALINELFKALSAKIDLVWLINRQKDSLILLKKFIEAINVSRVNVMKNLYFGDPEKFELFDNSKIKDSVDQVLHLSDLADRVSDKIYTDRLSLAAAKKDLGIGDRIEVTRFINEVNAEIDKVMDK